MKSDTEKRLQVNHCDDLKIVFFTVINIYLPAKFEKDQTVLNILESLSSLFVVELA